MFNKRPFGQQQKPEKKEEGCEVKLKRDKQGNIISKRISPGCTREHIKALRELDGREDNIVRDEKE